LAGDWGTKAVTAVAVMQLVEQGKIGLDGSMGIPPTGKPITFSGVNIFRMTNGQVVEDWVY